MFGGNLVEEKKNNLSSLVSLWRKMEGRSSKENLGGHLQPTQSPIFEQLDAIGSNTDRILPLDVRHLGDTRRNTSTWM